MLWYASVCIIYASNIIIVYYTSSYVYSILYPCMIGLEQSDSSQNLADSPDLPAKCVLLLGMCTIQFTCSAVIFQCDVYIMRCYIYMPVY